MRYHASLLPLTLLVIQAGCAPPVLMSGLGTDQSYAPQIATVESDHAIARRVTISIPKPAFVTVLEVEDGPKPQVLLRLASTDLSFRPLPAGTHRLTLAPMRTARDTVHRDVVAELLGSMGKPIGGTPRIEGVGYVPMEFCPGANPAAPTYCPVPPTEPLVRPVPIPPDHYLICIAHTDPVDRAQLRARLHDANLALRGRDLVTEIATAASGGERAGRWAAVAVRR